MSRAKVKLAMMHDLQSRQNDVILTKKDCDMIASALLKTHGYAEVKQLYMWFKNLSKL